MTTDNRCYEFGEFRGDIAERRLSHPGRHIPLRDKLFATLLVLLDNRGGLVTKDELMDKVWPSATVADSNLKHNISVLRNVLGDGENGECFVETVPKHGYRFVAAVTEGTVAFKTPRRTWSHRYALPLLVVVAGASGLIAFTKIAARPEPIHSLSVLPFTVRSGSPSDEYLGPAISDALATRISAR